MQELFGLPADRWNFESFYSENPDADMFTCKALASGAVAIYLDIISKNAPDQLEVNSDKADAIEQAMGIFNTFLSECSSEKGTDPTDYDPFAHDDRLKSIQVDESLKKQYSQRFKTLSTAFKKRFGVSNCQEILGFDPFRYEEYDEEMQETIEDGKWMKKCKTCIQFLVKTVAENNCELIPP